MSQWDLQANETSVYFKNYVNDEVVEAVQKKFMEGYDTIYVSFDVIGRTLHEQLSYQLSSRLRALYGPKVNIEVGYNYQCDVRWVTNLSQEVIEEELSTDVSWDLISRSELLKRFLMNKEGHIIPERGCDNLEVTVSIKDIKTIIKEQPTAYDVDKVVEELDKASYRIDDSATLSSRDVINIDDAIEIVKQGGTDASYSIQDIDNAIRNKGLLQSE